MTYSFCTQIPISLEFADNSLVCANCNGIKQGKFQYAVCSMVAVILLALWNDVGNVHNCRVFALVYIIGFKQTNHDTLYAYVSVSITSVRVHVSDGAGHPRAALVWPSHPWHALEPIDCGWGTCVTSDLAVNVNR